MSDLCLMLLTLEGTLIQCFDSRSDKISPPTSSRVTGSFDLRPLGIITMVCGSSSSSHHHHHIIIIITPVCGSSSRWKFWSKPRLRATTGRKKERVTETSQFIAEREMEWATTHLIWHFLSAPAICYSSSPPCERKPWDTWWFFVNDPANQTIATRLTW